jgi:small conductance mechanosensitive channel
MEVELAKYKMLRDIIMSDGLVILQALIMIVVGLILAKIIAKYFKTFFLRFGLKEPVAATASNSIYILIIVVLLAIGAQWVGLEAVMIRRILIGTSLAAVGLIIIFRPLIPTLPFKVGNTVKAGGLLGKVGAKGKGLPDLFSKAERGCLGDRLFPRSQ